MSSDFWKNPSWNTPIKSSDSVDIFRINERSIISEKEGPEHFWSQVSDRATLEKEEAKHIINLFQELKTGEPSRCHMPPWGLAFFKNNKLLFSVTMCFECDNAYIYTGLEKDLRAFDTTETNAKNLFVFLSQKLPLQEFN